MKEMKNIFSPIQVGGLKLKNRIVMPPMCQFCVEKEDGVANEWHYVHYVSRAIGGVGLIIIEMTNVDPDGRITNRCLGLWSDEQIQPLKRIVDECHRYGAKVAVQIAHAGRKAEDAPQAVSASEVAYSENSKTPRALSTQEVDAMVEKYKEAAMRAVQAGFDSIELHGAHGYLIQQFHSPLTNKREDAYGKDRALFGKRIIEAVRSVMPKEMPLIFRISAIEYVEGGYDLDYAVALCKEYQKSGVDIFHISSGGEGPLVGSAGRPGTHGGYQVPLARRIKEETGLPVIAVGKLESYDLANSVIGNEDADMVAIGRGLLRDANWPIQAALHLDIEADIPFQLKRAFPTK